MPKKQKPAPAPNNSGSSGASSSGASATSAKNPSASSTSASNTSNKKNNNKENNKSNDVNIKCPVCKVQAKSRCGGCNTVGYCSKEHQKLHWKIHKTECSPWKICESPLLGRYLIAVRDIKPGEVILDEAPLLLTPPKVTMPVCLKCYAEFQVDEEEQGSSADDFSGFLANPNSTPTPCSKCGWPMCGSEVCKNSNSHQHDYECQLTAARGGVRIRNFNQEHPMYRPIGVLRALALDSEKLNQLMNLQSSAFKRPNQDEEKDSKNEDDIVDESERSDMDFANQNAKQEKETDIQTTVRLIQNFFKRGDITEDWILKVIGIIETNGHEIPLATPTDEVGRRLIGVYHNSSFLEHNCRPNCVKAIDIVTKSILIRSAVAIKKGDHLSISYVDPLWGTNDRVNFLQMTKFFTCKCVRCCDPTELGCNISSVLCQKPSCINKRNADTTGKVGMILPEDPFNPEAEWKCSTCSEMYSAGYVGSIMEKVGKEMQILQPQRGTIAPAEDFIKKFQRSLAPNHFYFLEIKVELAQLYGRTPDEPLPVLPPKKLMRKIQLCKDLLEIFNVIAPGYNRLRALMMYELQAAVCMLSKLRQSVGEISRQQHREELMPCGRWLIDVIKMFEWEPENSVERKRGEGAKAELTILKNYLERLDAEEEAETQNTLTDDRNPDLDSYIEDVF